MPSGAEKHLVERFQLNADRRSLTYSFHVEDPEYLTEPVTGALSWAYQGNLEVSLEPCDLENARRYLED